jgi:hypothetical protein
VLFFFPVLFNPSCFILFPITKMCTWFWRERDTTNLKKWKLNFCHSRAAARETCVHDMQKYNLHLQWWFNQQLIKATSKWKEIKHSAYKPLHSAMLECINQQSTGGPASGIIFARKQFLCIRHGTGFWNFPRWLA